MANFRDLLKAAKEQIREVDTAEADELRQQPGAIVLDVREPDEYEQGAIPGAVHIPRGNLETSIEARVPDKTAPVIIHCASGVRSAFAAKTLTELGYDDVVSVAGGFNKWKDEGRDWAAPRKLTPEQRNRYQRHVLLPEVDVEGQLKLLDAKVLLLGAGGLGSPAALYLAAAGVGTLGIIDMDVVDESNLQRQILHNMDRIGDRKVDSAKKTLTAAQPGRQRRHLRRPPRRRQRDGDPRGLRRRRRRHRQLPDPLPRERRVGEARHPGGARLDLPLRGHGHRVRPEAGTHLPRHGPRAASGRAGPELRRGRRARRAARHRRLAPGDRGDQA